MVAEAPVDLLGHEEVVAAEAGLDVGDRVLLLRGDEGARECRVHVADHDHDRGVEAPELGLEGGHDPRRLLGVRPGADAEVRIGLGQAELGEEDVRELGVVVLAGVHECGREPGAAGGLEHGRGLHEVGASPCDDEEIGHRQASSSAVSQAAMAFSSPNRCSV